MGSVLRTISDLQDTPRMLRLWIKILIFGNQLTGLCGGSCKRSPIDICGGNGGESYDDESYTTFGPITGVSLTGDLYLDNIQMRYGRAWAPYHGGHGPDTIKYELDDDEKIVKVVAKCGAQNWNGSLATKLWMTTNKDTVIESPGGDDSPVFTYQHEGCYLQWISGRSGAWVDRIVFHWECP